jgi:hypothetical protein
MLGAILKKYNNVDMNNISKSFCKSMAKGDKGSIKSSFDALSKDEKSLLLEFAITGVLIYYEQREKLFPFLRALKIPLHDFMKKKDNLKNYVIAYDDTLFDDNIDYATALQILAGICDEQKKKLIDELDTADVGSDMSEDEIQVDTDTISSDMSEDDVKIAKAETTSSSSEENVKIKRTPTKSTRKPKQTFDKKGQKKDLTNVLNSTLIFYKSLYEEKPDSKMAIKWLVEHGVLDEPELSKAIKKL